MTIYHYTNANALVQIIHNREIWLTESNYLNDPSEISYAATEVLKVLAAKIEEEADVSRVDHLLKVREFLTRSYLDPDTLNQYVEDRSFIASCSRTDRSLTLWRLYAGRNGFSVGFDETKLLEWTNNEYPEVDSSAEIEEQESDAGRRHNYNLSARIQDVTYGDSEIQDIAEELINLGASSSPDFESEGRIREVLRRLSSIKHPAYEDEKETRVVVQELGDHAQSVGVRVSAVGSLVAFRSLSFPFSAVRSITIAPGSRSAQTRKALNSLLYTGGRGAWEDVKIREFNVPYVW